MPKIEEKKLAWLRKVTGLRTALPNIYALPGFTPNGAGPNRIFWGIRLYKIVPDWWPLTVAWRHKWKLTACADYHDFLYHLGVDEDDRTFADYRYRSCLESARQEITGWGPLVALRRRRMGKMKDIYFAAVRLLGERSFHYARKTAD